MGKRANVSGIYVKPLAQAWGMVIPQMLSQWSFPGKEGREGTLSVTEVSL